MKYTIWLVAVFLFAASFFPQKTFAEGQLHAGSSAQLQAKPSIQTKSSDRRVLALQTVFNRYNSPLSSEAENYVKYADKYGIDWKLLPAISGLESSFGVYQLSESHNAYGWGGGHIYFTSWENGIDTISKALAQNYYARGADTVYKIGPIYAESPTWAVRVTGFMNEIEVEYSRLNAEKALALNI